MANTKVTVDVELRAQLDQMRSSVSEVQKMFNNLNFTPTKKANMSGLFSQIEGQIDKIQTKMEQTSGKFNLQDTKSTQKDLEVLNGLYSRLQKEISTIEGMDPSALQNLFPKDIVSNIKLVTDLIKQFEDTVEGMNKKPSEGMQELNNKLKENQQNANKAKKELEEAQKAVEGLGNKKIELTAELEETKAAAEKTKTELSELITKQQQLENSLKGNKGYQSWQSALETLNNYKKQLNELEQQQSQDKGLNTQIKQAETLLNAYQRIIEAYKEQNTLKGRDASTAKKAGITDVSSATEAYQKQLEVINNLKKQKNELNKTENNSSRKTRISELNEEIKKQEELVQIQEENFKTTSKVSSAKYFSNAAQIKEQSQAYEEADAKVKQLENSLKEVKNIEDNASNKQNIFNQLQKDIESTIASINKLSASEASDLFNKLKQSASGLQLEGVDWSTVLKISDLQNIVSGLAPEQFEQLKQAMINLQIGGADWSKIMNIDQFNQVLSTMNDEWLNKLMPMLKGSGITGVDWNQITNIDQLKSALTSLVNDGVNKVKGSLPGMTSGLDQARTGMKQLEEECSRATESLQRQNSSISQIEQLASRASYFFGLTNQVQLFRRAIQNAIDTVEELDELMTETAVVTDFSVGDMWDKLPEYTEVAQKYGSTLSDAYEVMTIFYQQGLETNEVFDLGTQTMQMARIAGLDYAEAADRMTNALRAFNMELNETSATRVNDVYSALAASSASNVDELSTAMTKVASLASSANMSFENTGAFLAQMIETTRESAETAGTALKTVIARFSEVKSLYSEGELTGTDEEGEEINVNNVSKALRAAGIDLNEYLVGAKGLDDIFIELSEKWDSLDLVTQRYIATMAAGSRQQSRFLALMGDNERLTELVGIAADSTGASEEQFAKTQESLETKLNNLKTAWQTFLMGISNSTIIKAGVDLLTKLINTVNNLTSHLGEAGSAISRITLLAVGMKAAGTGIKMLSTWLINMVAGAKKAATGIGLVTTEVKALNAEATKVEVKELTGAAAGAAAKTSKTLATRIGTGLGVTTAGLATYQGQGLSTRLSDKIKEKTGSVSELKNSKIQAQNITLTGKTIQGTDFSARTKNKNANSLFGTTSDLKTRTAQTDLYGFDEFQTADVSKRGKIKGYSADSGEGFSKLNNELNDSLAETTNSFSKLDAESGNLTVTQNKANGEITRTYQSFGKIADESGNLVDATAEVSEVYNENGDLIRTTNTLKDKEGQLLLEQQSVLDENTGAQRISTKTYDTQNKKMTEIIATQDGEKVSIEKNITAKGKETLSEKAEATANDSSTASEYMEAKANAVSATSEGGKTLSGAGNTFKLLGKGGMLSSLASGIGGVLAEIWPLIVALAALAAIVGTIIYSYKTSAGQQEISQQSKIEQDSQNLQDRIEAFSEQVQNLTDSLSEVEEGTESLKKLVKGTEEYEEAIEANNEQIKQMVSDYPDLKESLRYDTETGEYYFVDQDEKRSNDIVNKKIQQLEAEEKESEYLSSAVTAYADFLQSNLDTKEKYGNENTYNGTSTDLLSSTQIANEILWSVGTQEEQEQGKKDYGSNKYGTWRQVAIDDGHDIEFSENFDYENAKEVFNSKEFLDKYDTNSDEYKYIQSYLENYENYQNEITSAVQSTLYGYTDETAKAVTELYSKQSNLDDFSNYIDTTDAGFNRNENTQIYKKDKNTGEYLLDENNNKISYAKGAQGAYDWALDNGYEIVNGYDDRHWVKDPSTGKIYNIDEVGGDGTEKTKTVNGEEVTVQKISDESFYRMAGETQGAKEVEEKITEKAATIAVKGMQGLFNQDIETDLSNFSKDKIDDKTLKALGFDSYEELEEQYITPLREKQQQTISDLNKSYGDIIKSEEEKAGTWAEGMAKTYNQDSIEMAATAQNLESTLSNSGAGDVAQGATKIYLDIANGNFGNTEDFLNGDTIEKTLVLDYISRNEPEILTDDFDISEYENLSEVANNFADYMTSLPDGAIEKAQQFKTEIAEGGENATLASVAMGLYADQIDAGAQAMEVFSSDTFGDVANDLKSIYLTTGNISASNIRDAADDCDELSAALQEGTLKASAMAEIMKEVSKGTLDLSEVTDELVDLYNDLYYSADLAGDAIAALEKHDIGESDTKLGSTYQDYWEEVQDLIDSGAYGDSVLNDYMDALMGGSWEEYLASYGNDVQAAIEAANKQYGFSKNEVGMQGSWQTLINGQGGNIDLGEGANIGLQNGQVVFDLTNIESTEDLIKKISEKLGVSEEYAQALVADAKTYSNTLKGALSSLDAEAATRKLILEYYNDQTGKLEITTDEINAIAGALGKTKAETLDWLKQWTVDGKAIGDNITEITERIGKASKNTEGIWSFDVDTTEAKAAIDKAFGNNSDATIKLSTEVDSDQYRQQIDALNNDPIIQEIIFSEVSDDEKIDVIKQYFTNLGYNMTDEQVVEIATMLISTDNQEYIESTSSAIEEAIGTGVEAAVELIKGVEIEIPIAVTNGSKLATLISNAFGDTSLISDLVNQKYTIKIGGEGTKATNLSTGGDYHYEAPPTTSAATTTHKVDPADTGTTTAKPDTTYTTTADGSGSGDDTQYEGKYEKDYNTLKDIEATQRKLNHLQREQSELQDGGLWTYMQQQKNLDEQLAATKELYDEQEDLVNLYSDERNDAYDELGSASKYVELDEDGNYRLSDAYYTAKENHELTEEQDTLLDTFFGKQDNLTDAQDQLDQYTYDYEDLEDQKDDLRNEAIDQGVEYINNAIDAMGKLAQAAIQMIESVAQAMVDGFNSFLDWMTINIDDEHDINEVDTAYKNQKERIDWERERLFKQLFDYSDGTNALNQEVLFDNMDSAAQSVLTRLQNQRRLYENSFRKLKELNLNLQGEVTDTVENIENRLLGNDSIFNKLKTKINSQFSSMIHSLKGDSSELINFLTNFLGGSESGITKIITDIIGNFTDSINFDWFNTTKDIISYLSNLDISGEWSSLFDDITDLKGNKVDLGLDNLLSNNWANIFSQYLGEDVRPILDTLKDLTPNFDEQYKIVNKAELVDALSQKLGTIITSDTITSQLVQSYLDYLTEIESQMESEVENIRSAETEILNLYDEIKELMEVGKDEYADLQQQLYDAVSSEKNDLKEELEKLNENITDADSDLIDILKNNLDQIRQMRENDNTETDLRNKEARLAYLKQDTSNANLQEILKLEKELDEGQESYTDKLIDQKIDELENQNQEAADQRQVQIDLLQAEIDNTDGIWDTVEQMLDKLRQWDKTLNGEIDRDAYNEIMKYLKDTDDYKNNTSDGRERKIQEWTETIRAASLYAMVHKGEDRNLIKSAYNNLGLMVETINKNTFLPDEYAQQSEWDNYVAFSKLETTASDLNDTLKDVVESINNVIQRLTISYTDQGNLYEKMTIIGGLVQAVSGAESAATKAAEDISSELPGILTQVTTGIGNIIKGLLKVAGSDIDTIAATFVSGVGTNTMSGASLGGLTIGDIGEAIGMIVEGFSNFMAAGADAGAMGMGMIGDMAPGISDISVALLTNMINLLANKNLHVLVSLDQASGELEKQINSTLEQLNSSTGNLGMFAEGIEKEIKSIEEDKQVLAASNGEHSTKLEGYQNLYARTLALVEIMNALKENYTQAIDRGYEVENSTDLANLMKLSTTSSTSSTTTQEDLKDDESQDSTSTTAKPSFFDNISKLDALSELSNMATSVNNKFSDTITGIITQIVEGIQSIFNITENNETKSIFQKIFEALNPLSLLQGIADKIDDWIPGGGGADLDSDFTNYNEYASGGSIGKRQTALVGEAGAELIQRPNGTATLATSPQMMDLHRGDIIYNADQTKKILEGGGLNFSRFAEGTVGNLMTRDILGMGIADISIGLEAKLPNSSEMNKENSFNFNLNLEDLTVDSPDRVEEVADRVWNRITSNVSNAMWPYNRL